YEVAGLNLPHVDPKTAPDPNACSSRPFLRLSSGQEMQSIGGGGMSAENYYDGGDQFPPLPEGVIDATLVFPCLLGTLPGTAPENWGVSFHLVRNPTAPTVFPVQQLDTPSSEDIGIPTVGSEKNAFLKQISLKIDSIAEVEDGFIIMGSVQTSSDQYTIDPFFPPGAIVIMDSTGVEIPAEVASVGNDNPAMADNQPVPAKWAYKIQGKYFHGPLTLSVNWLTISPNDPILFTVDVGSRPQDNQIWILDKQLNLFGSEVFVQSAKYIVGEDMGFHGMQGLEFSVRLPEEIEGLQLNYWDPNPQPGSEVGGTSLSDGLKHGKDTVQIGFLSTLPLSGSVGVTANVISVDGPWTAIWNPPVVEGAPSPTPIPHACLTNESWEAIQKGPAPSLPSSVTGRMFLTKETAPGNIMDMFLSGLDGTGEQLLQKGAMDGALSEDGKRLAFINSSGSLSVLNLDTHKMAILTTDDGAAHPIWSPNGQWIAFVINDQSGGPSRLFLIRSDGTDRREVGVKSNGRDLAGWFPDSSSLLILATDDDRVAGFVLKTLDLATDDASPVLPGIFVSGAALSSDGEWIAYQKQEFGKNAPWISIARLDGSDRRLLAKMDGRWVSSNPVWSPDGHWLSISMLDTENWDQAFGMNIIVNPTTCGVVPLPGLDGVIKSWIP
ncbi:MAG TPA: hypothetical protein VII90_05235, partial [Anaerolineales bacterium]